MLPKAIAVATLCASAVLAHSPVHARRAHNHHFQARQASGSTSASATGTPHSTPPAATPTASRSSSQSRPPASQSTPAPTHAGGTSVTTTTTSVPTPTFDAPVVPISTAPGAIPLASILPNPATGPVPSPVPTYPAGTKPKGIPNAPPLPNIGSWNGNAYPTPDKAPPTDSDEVLTWVQQVRDSGVVIPDIAPYVNNPNGLCNDPSNQPRIGNETACWWSCGHCTRKTDIIQCRKSKVWGSSFDDGPTLEDGTLLHYLDAQQLDTTFFVVGSRVAGRPSILQTEYLAGHQIGVHTWSHTPLTTQTSEQVIAELGWTKKVIKDAIGVTPYYFRPPYGDIDDRVRAIARAMNLTVVMWTTTGSPGHDVAFDTFDHQVPGGVVHAEESVNQFAKLLQVAESYGTGFIVLEHDLWWQEVALAVGYFLPTALGYGYDVTSIGNCMQQNIADTYVETSSTKQIPPGSGIGGEITGTGQVAPSNAPLGGSDGSNTDINVPSTDNPIDTDGTGSGFLSRDLGAWTMAAGFVLAGALTVASGL